MKTNELTGAALDWAVAKAQGLSPSITSVAEQAERFRNVFHHDGSKPAPEAVAAVIASLKPRIYCNDDKLTPIPSYSTDWSQGGPIIEREKICPCPASTATGAPWSATDLSGHVTQFGPAPLIAAMRCYVASKLGDEIEIPKELL